MRALLSWDFAGECPLNLLGEVYPSRPKSVKAYNEFMVRTWKINRGRPEEILIEDSSSLDAVTKQLLPDGYYSTFRTYGGCTRVIGLSAHLRRLPDADAASLRRNLILVLEPYRPGEARVRVMQSKRGRFYISMEPLRPLPSDTYEKGVNVQTTSLHRNDPHVKSTAFIGATSKEREHLAKGNIFEALLVKAGKILEGMTSNFFYVIYADQNEVQSKRLTLCTARRDILPGVTRTMVIRAARGRGVEVRYRALKLEQLPAVQEAFLTSSSRGVVPVVRIDEVQVGQGSPGRITRMLMAEYERYVLIHAEKI